jgi:hypothetical protein
MTVRVGPRLAGAVACLFSLRCQPSDRTQLWRNEVQSLRTRVAYPPGNRHRPCSDQAESTGACSSGLGKWSDRGAASVCRRLTGCYLQDIHDAVAPRHDSVSARGGEPAVAVGRSALLARELISGFSETPLTRGCARWLTESEHVAIRPAISAHWRRARRVPRSALAAVCARPRQLSFHR